MNEVQFQALVRELTTLPRETEWVELKHNKAVPSRSATTFLRCPPLPCTVRIPLHPAVSQSSTDSAAFGSYYFKKIPSLSRLEEIRCQRVLRRFMRKP
jgi:hypothetical protein